MILHDLGELNKGQRIVVRINTPLENWKFDLELVDSSNFERLRSGEFYTPDISHKWGELRTETIVEIPHSGHWYLVSNNRNYQEPSNSVLSTAWELQE